MTRRRALERAMRIRSASDQGNVTVPPPVTTSLLRRDAYAGNQSISSFLRQFDWARRRAELMDRAALPLQVGEYVVRVAQTRLHIAVVRAHRIRAQRAAGLRSILAERRNRR